MKLVLAAVCIGCLAALGPVMVLAERAFAARHDPTGLCLLALGLLVAFTAARVASLGGES